MGKIVNFKCNKCGYRYVGNEIQIDDKPTLVYALDALALRNDCCKENIQRIDE